MKERRPFLRTLTRACGRGEAARVACATVATHGVDRGQLLLDGALRRALLSGEAALGYHSGIEAFRGVSTLILRFVCGLQSPAASISVVDAGT